MRLTPTTTRHAPGNDPWMERVSMSRSVSPFVGWVERHTAADLVPDDPTPGVYPLTYEFARLERSHPRAPWSGELRTIEVGDHAWTFPTRSAPAEAWAVLQAADSISASVASSHRR